MRNRNAKFKWIGYGLILLAMTAAGCNFNYSVGIPKEPTDRELQKLTKETLAHFAESLEKDDFEIIRKSASTTFRKQFTAEQIRKSFISYIDMKDRAVRLFLSAQTLEADFETRTMKENDGQYLLEIAGTFPTSEATINFHFNYLRENGQWKLVKIEIRT